MSNIDKIISLNEQCGAIRGMKEMYEDKINSMPSNTPDEEALEVMMKIRDSRRAIKRIQCELASIKP